MKIFVLLAMIFCHIVDDFYLQRQGNLGFLKQKDWWEENAPDELYRNDYKVALIAHAFSWAFMVHLPIMVYMVKYNMVNTTFITRFMVVFIFNWIIHAVVDDIKANDKASSLILDQTAHMLQIIVTWLVFHSLLFMCG